MREPIPESFNLYGKYPLAELLYHQDLQLALVLTTGNFLPFNDFKMIFSKVGEVAEKYKLNKILFDKRSLTIFHQPSMEWYYLVRKAEMLQQNGIKEHGKILPKDYLFQRSVEQARDKIFSENPTHSIHQLNIRYYKNFQEVLEN